MIGNCKSLLDIQFTKFCNSYGEDANSLPLKILGDQPIKYMLNDDKIKGKEIPINKLYSRLVDIQNKIIIE